MRFLITYLVEVEDDTQIPAFRDAGDAALQAAGATVTGAHSSQEQTTFRVIGVMAESHDPFECTQVAIDADEAKLLAVTEDEERIVAQVRPVI